MSIGKVSTSNPYKLHSFADRNISHAQGGLTASTLGSENPQVGIDTFSKFAALKGHAYNIESYQIQQAQNNKKANAATHNLALPAREVATA